MFWVILQSRYIVSGSLRFNLWVKRATGWLACLRGIVDYSLHGLETSYSSKPEEFESFLRSRAWASGYLIPGCRLSDATLRIL